MKNILSATGFLALFFTGFTTLEAVTKPDAREEFEALAAKCSYFEIDDALYNRAGAFADQRATNAAEYPGVLAGITGSAATNDELTALLKHSDPKVRTLAIAALAERGPKNLPLIADLLSDDAVTFSRQGPLAQSMTIKPELRKDVTVGENAQEVLFFYLSPAGYTGYQSVGKRQEFQKSRTQFDAYWKTHKDRTFCASWFAVQLQRASRGTPEQLAAAKTHIRDDIAKIPQPERTWICLWLNNEQMGSQLYSKDQLIGICRENNPGILLDALTKQRFPSDDPDLQHDSANNFLSTARFILQNAPALLRPEDSTTLLTLNKDKNSSPWWCIAAAHLQPDKAAEILHNAYGVFSKDYQRNERVDLCLALWDLVGESQISYISDKFYSDALAARSWLGDCGYGFIDGIAKNNRRPGAKLVAAILQDKRLDDYKIDRMTFASFASAVNKWAGKPIVSDDEIAAVGKGEGGKGGDPTPINLPLKRELLHRMRDCAAEWSSAAPATGNSATATPKA